MVAMRLFASMLTPDMRRVEMRTPLVMGAKAPCPVPCTKTGTPCVPAKWTAATTSSAVLAPTTTSGSCTIAVLKQAASSSRPASPRAKTTPEIRARRSATASRVMGVAISRDYRSRKCLVPHSGAFSPWPRGGCPPCAGPHILRSMVQVSEERRVPLVRSWLARSADAPTDAAAARLAGVLRDPKGLPFTVGFVDGVVRPEDLRVAARNLWRLRGTLPRFLPAYQRAAILVGGVAGQVLPWPVVPIARGVLRRMVGHLVLDS